MTKKILLINDFSSYGKVALSAMAPILCAKKYEVVSLPTLIVSNTFNYGKFATIDTTDYMKESVAVWEDLGLCFDAVSTGFVANEEQAQFLYDFCKEQSQAGALIFVDPVMADNGKLYNSVSVNKVDIISKLISISDVAVPNITEACLIAGVSYDENGFTEADVRDIAKKICALGVGSVVITSALCLQDNGESHRVVAGYDRKTSDCFMVPYEELPVKVNGAGDTFLAFLMGEMLAGADLRASVTKSVCAMHEKILENMDVAGEYNGLPG